MFNNTKTLVKNSAIVSVTLIMGTLSFACGFLLLGFNAAAIDHIKHRYSDYCSAHTHCTLKIQATKTVLCLFII